MIFLKQIAVNPVQIKIVVIAIVLAVTLLGDTTNSQAPRRRDGGSLSTPHCFMEPDATTEEESDCSLASNEDSLTAPNCYLLTQASSGGTYTANSMACPWAADTESLDNILTLQPIDNTIEGTHDCNGVPISINVECTDGENPIFSYLGGVINFLAAGVGVVVVAVVAYSGVQYITSRGDPQKLSAAKGRLINALIGLISFIFLYAFLQWLIPGGLFDGGGGSSPPAQNPCTPGQPC